MTNNGFWSKTPCALDISFSNTNKWSYQEKIEDELLAIAFKSGKAICGAACGAGKNTIIQHVAQKLIQSKGKNFRVLVLAENNKALQSQLLESIRNPFTKIEFTFGEMDTNEDVQVRVGIAAGLHRLPWDHIDAILVDECHRHYLEKRVQKFINKLRPKYQVLFTGTPSKFVKNNSQERNSNIVFISGSELQKLGVYSGVTLDVFKTENKKEPGQTIKDFLRYAKKVRADLSKVLVVCPSISYANIVAKYLSQYGKTVFLSTSKCDPENKILNESKTSQNGFVITVNKTSLGYNDSSILTLVDLRSSLSSLDNNQQIFARVLRQSPCASRKSYFRVGQSSDYNRQVLMCHKLKSLMDRETFSRFDGSNLRTEIRPMHGNSCSRLSEIDKNRSKV